MSSTCSGRRLRKPPVLDAAGGALARRHGYGPRAFRLSLEGAPTYAPALFDESLTCRRGAAVSGFPESPETGCRESMPKRGKTGPSTVSAPFLRPPFHNGKPSAGAAVRLSAAPDKAHSGVEEMPLRHATAILSRIVAAHLSAG